MKQSQNSPSFFPYSTELAVELVRQGYKPEFVDQIVGFRLAYKGSTAWLVTQVWDHRLLGVKVSKIKEHWESNVAKLYSKFTSVTKQDLFKDPKFIFKEGTEWYEHRNSLYDHILTHLQREVSMTKTVELPKKKLKKKKKHP